MESESFKILKQVVDAFRAKHGWAKGLSKERYHALNVADTFIKNVEEGKNANANEAMMLRSAGLSIREIMRTMGFKHPGSVSHLLNQYGK